MGSANDLHDDPLTTIALLATAEAHEFLEGIGLSFQPDDAEFAETIHEELYHEQLLTPPQTWGNAQRRGLEDNSIFSSISNAPNPLSLGNSVHTLPGARAPAPI
jgi:hypothetical protein